MILLLLFIIDGILISNTCYCNDRVMTMGNRNWWWPLLLFQLMMILLLLLLFLRTFYDLNFVYVVRSRLFVVRTVGPTVICSWTLRCCCCRCSLFVVHVTIYSRFVHSLLLERFTFHFRWYISLRCCYSDQSIKRGVLIFINDISDDDDQPVMCINDWNYW